MAQALEDRFGCIINMWAVLDYDNKTVIGLVPPDKSLEDYFDEINGRITIEMTVENSPGYLNGTYENGKFYPPKELING